MYKNPQSSDKYKKERDRKRIRCIVYVDVKSIRCINGACEKCLVVDNLFFCILLLRIVFYYIVNTFSFCIIVEQMRRDTCKIYKKNLSVNQRKQYVKR